jgi:hypothetical protein
MGWQEPGCKDDLADHPRAGQRCCHCEAKGHHDQRCLDTYPGQCCVGLPLSAVGDSGVEGISCGPYTHP